MVELAGKMNFPWLMSNVRDKHTGGLLAEGERRIILEWKGKKVSKKIFTKRVKVYSANQVLASNKSSLFEGGLSTVRYNIRS